jgi:hypothetical protein
MKDLESKNFKEIVHLEDQGVDGKIKQTGWGMCSVDSSGSRRGAVAGFGEQSHKH